MLSSRARPGNWIRVTRSVVIGSQTSRLGGSQGATDSTPMGEAPMTRRRLASVSRAVSAIAAALVVALAMSGPAAAADVQQTAFGFGSDWKAQFNYSFAEW